MARFVRGDVVAVPFPLSEKPGTRSRPALIVASWFSETGTDYLACVIATRPAQDPHFMELTPTDFASGPLEHPSFIRPSYLFSIDEASVKRRLGSLTADKLDAVLSTLASLFR